MLKIHARARFHHKLPFISLYKPAVPAKYKVVSNIQPMNIIAVINVIQ